MKEGKDFDCVEMKWEIQRRIREEYGKLPEDDARRLQWEKVTADPFWKAFLAAVPVRRAVAANE
ncbi:MAG: hypothetical protein FJ279_32630 [Planctomycetes bacterium]|nr:hypothetical protein [Planctomycetota bacterium]